MLGEMARLSTHTVKLSVYMTNYINLPTMYFDAVVLPGRNLSDTNPLEILTMNLHQTLTVGHDHAERILDLLLHDANQLTNPLSQADTPAGLASAITFLRTRPWSAPPVQ